MWNDRLSGDSAVRRTFVAEQAGTIVGLTHTVLDDDATWGALLDNLHVRHDLQGRGLGATLLRLSGAFVAENRPDSALYLWVLEQNHAAQGFYDALGGQCVERGQVPPPPPRGDPTHLNGSPSCLRYVWRDPRMLNP